MISNDLLKQALLDTFEDKKLDPAEKRELFDKFCALNKEQRSFVRNRAFELVKTASTDEILLSLKWLEQVVRCLDTSEPALPECNAYFSPGDECLNSLLHFIKSAKSTLDVCVFTISDNRIRDALKQAHDRGTRVRIITDNDKTMDDGSDIDELIAYGLQIRIDRTRHHMHHKFAIQDNSQLATGSFNWTRSASLYNYENVVIMNDQGIVSAFQNTFSQLWKKFV